VKRVIFVVGAEEDIFDVSEFNDRLVDGFSFEETLLVSPVGEETERLGRDVILEVYVEEESPAVDARVDAF
jgi:hypothetical protein